MAIKTDVEGVELVTPWLRDALSIDPGRYSRMITVDGVAVQVGHGGVGYPMCVRLHDGFMWVHRHMAGWENWAEVATKVRAMLAVN